MKPSSLTLLLVLLFAIGAQAQETPLPLGFGKSADDSHIHGAACFTLHLQETEEGRQALREYRQWEQDGRPDIRSRQRLGGGSVATIGTKRNFRVLDFNNNQAYITVEFELRHDGTRSKIWVQTSEFGSNKVSQAKVDAMAQGLEVLTPPLSIDPSKGILENNVSVFGNRPNVDNSGVVHLLVYRFYPTEIPSGSYVAGYFSPTNLSPTASNSNFADIIHINSNPAVYRDGGNVDLGGILNTIAHEDQHLVHARAGQLVAFQNEGQSEWASILNGYPTRSTGYLNLPANVNLNLFTWRTGNDVLYDYARAGLFHNYLGDRFGRTRVGAMSFSGLSNVAAYNSALSGTGVAFDEVLIDFHTANWVNSSTIEGGKYGYVSQQRRNVSVVNPAENYSSVFLNVTTNRTVQYGGAEYLQITGVKNPQITVTNTTVMRYKLILQPVSGPVQVRNVTASQTLTGDFQYVTLVAANPSTTPASFSFSANWDPLPFITENLNYAAASAFFAELPGDATLADQPNRRFFKGYAIRIDPTYAGRLQQLSYTINSRSESIRGSGTLRISLYSAVLVGNEAGTSIARYNPNLSLKSIDVPFSDIGTGFNTVDVRDQNWLVNGATNYFLLFEVVNHTPDARLEFLLDAGSTNQNDPRYFPIRTLIKRVDDNNVTTWGGWSGRNNQLLSATVFSEYTGVLETPVLSGVPTQPVNVLQGTTLQLTVSATGTPTPVFQWRKDGVMIAGQTTSTLTIPSISTTSSGTYEVRATNFAGATAYQSFEVTVVPNQYRLTQNYPNPFNPTTRIEFTIINRSAVTLKVYDVAGRLVRTLADSDFERGLYSVDLDATGLSSGVYFYQLIATPRSGATGFSSTKKMLIVK